MISMNGQTVDPISDDRACVFLWLFEKKVVSAAVFCEVPLSVLSVQ